MKEENSRPNREFKLFTGASGQKEFLEALRIIRDAEKNLPDNYKSVEKKYKRRKLKCKE